MAVADTRRRGGAHASEPASRLHRLIAHRDWTQILIDALMVLGPGFLMLHTYTVSVEKRFGDDEKSIAVLQTQQTEMASQLVALGGQLERNDRDHLQAEAQLGNKLDDVAVAIGKASATLDAISKGLPRR